MYDIRDTQMVQFERKGEMIPNLYVFVDGLDEEMRLASTPKS